MNRTTTLVWAAAFLAAGCAPWPRTTFVPEVPPQALVHSDCAFNTHVPVAARLAVGQAVALIGITQTGDGRRHAELRLDVPTGTTLRFEDDRLEVRRPGGDLLATGRFAGVSLVDNPVVNLSSPVADVRARQLPLQAPLVGGEVGVGASRSPRHFWLAAEIAVPDDGTFELVLPALRDDTGAVHRLRLRFKVQKLLAVATINC